VASMSIVLDTHVLVWWVSDPGRLSPALLSHLKAASAEAPLLVPDICLWEIATLVSLGRLRLTLPLSVWLARATAPPLVEVVPISAEIAAEVAALPDSFHRDPGDRLIVATARVMGLPLATVDGRIRSSGLVALLD
jgi:PIN domain nuclease of toxin-antitoxin system